MFSSSGLRASDVDCSRAFFALGDFEGDGIANLQIVKCNATEVFGVEEKVLSLAFARDKAESTVRKSLDSSVHIFDECVYNVRNLDALFLCLNATR